jgi:hypothetical protein
MAARNFKYHVTMRSALGISLATSHVAGNTPHEALGEVLRLHEGAFTAVLRRADTGRRVLSYMSAAAAQLHYCTDGTKAVVEVYRD